LSEIVFILGAGASKDAGAPLMADFLDKADELRREGKVNQFKADFDRVFDARSNLQPVHSKARLEFHNIESLFAAFEMARLVNKLPGISNEDIESVLQSIRRLIFATLEKTVVYKTHRENILPNETYKSFAQLVSDLNHSDNQNRCSVMTFNYDLALDYAMLTVGRPPNYHLGEPVKWHCTTFLKLHGSLNWARCSKCREIVPWGFDDFFRKFQFHNLSETHAVCLDLASKLSSSELKHCGQSVLPDPVIVPPTWNKSEHHQSLSKVWQRAALELSDAENIFVSGYSLTETDSFFRYLYALGSVGKTLIKRFWVFDPDESVRSKFMNLIGSGVERGFHFEKTTFFQAIDFIRKELGIKKKTP
jgi:NAD-dependent SIR2 family protein deacetylase